MSKFQFKLQTLLNMRCRRRDQCRQVLAEIRRHEAELAARAEQIVQQRMAQLEELRRLNSAGELNVDATSARRYFAGQLTLEIASVERQRRIVATQIDFCRQSLVKADQDVKSLENLKEKQQAEFIHAQEQRAQRELEDGWSATHRSEVWSC